MIEVHLIGYTADLRHLVLDVDPDAARGRYRLVVDADLVATLDELRGRRADLAPPPVREPPATESAEPAAEPVDAAGEVAEEHAEAVEPPPAPIEAAEFEVVEVEAVEQATEERRQAVASALAPAQIQALLRSGRSPASVAKAAGTDLSWVERWLPPIVAEREQVIRDAQALRLNRPRRGESRRTLGEAVAANLAERGVDHDDILWLASRRADGRWTVSVRYRARGRTRTASWSLDRDRHSVSPASQLARDLGWSDQPVRGRRAATRRTRLATRSVAPTQSPTAGRARDADGQARKAAGQPRKASGQPRKAAGQPRKASGQPRKAAGQARKAAGQARKAAGQPRKTAGQPRKTEDEPPS